MIFISFAHISCIRDHFIPDWWFQRFQPLWKIWKSVGMLIPDILEKCSKPPTRYGCMGHKQAPSKCWPWQRHRRKRRGSCCCASQARNTVKYQCLCSETRDSPNETTYRAVMHPRWMSTSSTTPMCVSKKCLKGNSKLETTILRVKTNHFSACWCFFQTNKSSIDIQGWVENDVHPSPLGRPTRNFTAAEALLPLGKSCVEGKALGPRKWWPKWWETWETWEDGRKPAPVDDKIHVYPITIPWFRQCFIDSHLGNSPVNWHRNKDREMKSTMYEIPILVVNMLLIYDIKSTISILQHQ